MEEQLLSFLTFTLYEDEWLRSRSVLFTSLREGLGVLQIWSDSDLTGYRTMIPQPIALVTVLIELCHY
jgi:hypothetical protein